MCVLKEPFVLSSAVEKHKNQNIQNYNFACGPAWETLSLPMGGEEECI
jgi:hypothetical protein